MVTTVAEHQTENSVIAARSQVERLAAAELELARQRLGMEAELRQALADAGDAELAAVLDSARNKPRDSQAGRRLAELRDRIAALDRAAEAARRQRLAAIPAVWQAEAAQLRAQAAKLRAEGEAHQRRTRELLLSLQEHEGCQYVPWQPDASTTAGVYRDPVSYQLPRSQLMLGEADGFEAQATQLARQAISRSGTAQGETVEQLLAAMLGNGMRDTPAPAAVIAWAAEAETQERARRRRIPSTAENYRDPDGPLAFVLVWSNGQIEPRQSRVVSGDPDG